MKYFTTRAENVRLDDNVRRIHRGSYVRTGRFMTHYELAGPEGGELIVFVGGLTIPLYYWDRLTPRMHEAGFRTLTFSGYGRGYSDRPQVKYDEVLFVEQLRGLCVALGVQPQHVVGTSMGALVSMAFVQQYPNGVDSTTLIGPAGLDDSVPRAAALLNHDKLGAVIGKVAGRRVLDRHLGRNVADPVLGQELAGMIEHCYCVEGSLYALCSTVADFALAGRQQLYADHHSGGVPSFLIWGSEDQVTPISRFDDVESLLSPSQALVIEQCGHMASFEKPEHVSSSLIEFMNKIRRDQR